MLSVTNVTNILCCNQMRLLPLGPLSVVVIGVI
jgi:hypothetical protein